ncbi:MAG: universal stress protein [Pseudomonas sp.]|uniref:universal stress protein n=1 Tax=Pseudomonas sp. TaxID=306 RepID=UPI0027356F99|nr:universal stress protein [Pseudomonas sp.]MDP3846218.1 universal stress protein [Pseudomonas sp.]
MQAIRSILVVIQPHQPDGLALKRAKLIAGVTQSHLHLLVCEKNHDHQAELDALAASLSTEGFSVSTQQNWLSSIHQTVIAAQQAEGCGLIIKQHTPDNPLKKLILTPDDWKLLRYCPAPVLMVKSDKPWTNGTVLAAVDAGNADGEHRALHSSIINHGFDIAELAQGVLHVISAYPSPMLSAADPTFQLKESIEARYKNNCQAFLNELALAPECLHIEEGPADVLIPFMASKLNAVLTVIGTVARTGISGALIGNTAEVILDTLDSDVLVLKPDDVIDHLEELVAQR